MIVEAVNWLLVNGAGALLWCWALLGTAAGALWTLIDTLLNPLLSPVLAVCNPVFVWLGDAVYWLLSHLPPWLSLTVLSFLAGIAMLIGFRYTSNQRGIGNAKDQIKANLLALKLYKDDLWVTLHVQWRLLGAVLRLQWYMIPPVAIMMIPMLPALSQIGIRHQWRPLESGERTLITIVLRQSAADITDAELEPNAGVDVEVGPVPGEGALKWRVRGGRPGRHMLQFRLPQESTGGGETVAKELVVGSDFQRVSAMRVGKDWVHQLLHPVEARLPANGPVRSIEIAYPPIRSRIYGSNWWLLHFFVVSMLTAIVLRPLFRVRF